MLSNLFNFLKDTLPGAKKVSPGIKAAIPVLLVAIFILLNVAIWWAGPWLTIEKTQPLTSLTARGLTSVIFSLGCLALWGLFQWRKLHGFIAERAHEKQLEEDPIQRLEERQEVELDQVMLGLKKSLNKRNYLYALPWYLVLGLENAGKTSLINRSGHNFVFSSVMRASGLKSENPYSFDWWIGDDSVLIDPDGELLTQQATNQESNGETERRLWLHFINWLEKNRSRRPLNGVVVTLDIAHLATATASERRAYASLMRARLRELMEMLSTRLPVYIALTKLDLLQGFEPFFRHYNKSERDDVLGFTFSVGSMADLDRWLEEFDRDFEQFVVQINSMMPDVMMQGYNAEERSAIYSFSRQMAGLHDVLKQFLFDAFSSDQFSTSPLVRGVYFTSVFQQGVPADAFVDSASRRYGLAQSINTAQNAENSTTFFTEKLFTRVIYPEAGLASDNFRVARNKRRVMMLSAVACSIASVLLIGTWHRYYLKNSHQEDAVLAKVNDYRDHYSAGNYLDSGSEMLKPLNTIRDATLEFGFFHEKSRYISDLGLYQGHRIGPDVERTYLNLLEFRFLPALMKTVVTDLARAKTDEARLEALRIYRMLTDKSGRTPGLVRQYFAQKWQAEYTGQREIQTRLMQHLDYALKHTDLQGERKDGNAEAVAVLRPYDGLVGRAQTALSEMPIEERVYRNLKQSSSEVLGAPLNLKTNIGPIFDLVFSQRSGHRNDVLVPRMLTRRGFETYFMPKSDSVAELALLDSWVLGQTESVNFSDEDKQALRDKIRNLYVADYADTWRKAMNGFDIKYFPDINSAVMVLDNITGNMQPLTRLLTEVTDNTLLFPPLPKEDAARDALMMSPRYRVAAMVDNQFPALNRLVRDESGKPVYLNEVSDAVAQLLSYMKAINDAPDVGRAALEATKARVSLKNADPIYVLERVADGMPAPFQIMLKKLAAESWYVVKQEAIRYLEVRWEKDVYAYYHEKLAPRYPFSTRASHDVSLVDFEAFFAPDGILNTFYQDNLKIFLQDGGSLTGSADGQSLIRPEVLHQLKLEQQLQQAFFNRKGVLNVEFSLEPLEMSPNKRRSIIHIDGQSVEYSHGPRKTVGLVWPNTLREGNSSKLTLVPNAANQSPRSIDIQGPWAFFRLLDKGQIVGSTASSVDYRFSIEHGSILYRLHADADTNPFTTSLFRAFNLPRSLY